MNWPSLQWGARWLSIALPMPRVVHMETLFTALPMPWVVLRSNIHGKCYFKITIRWQMFFECRRWKRSANSESNKLEHLHPGKNASIPRDFLCYSSSIDKTVRSLSETKQPSSWHSSGSTAGRHRRFQALCTEGKEPAQATWPPDPEWELSPPCYFFSLSPLSVVYSYYNMKCFHGSARCKKKYCS